ncbi:MAG TPA: hypothetical protein VK762_02735 [Polyangiaceae bacterium]|nr:hypothetical protein [Polyangiaceae bacterium]
MLRRRWCGGLCALLFGVGCGSGGSGAPGDGGGGGELSDRLAATDGQGGGSPTDATVGQAGGDGGSGVGNDAASEGDGGPVDASALDGYFGRVDFEWTTQNGSPVRSVVLNFQPATSLGSLFECGAGAEQSGSCCYAPPSAVTAAASLSAGTVDVIVDNGSTGTVPYQNGYVLSHPAWTTNDILEVSAEGGTIEAFTASTQAPDDVRFNAPTPTQASVAADLLVQWAPTTEPYEVAKILVEISLPNTNGNYVKCIAPDDAGALTVPAALLGHLSPTDAGSLIIVRTNSNTMTTSNATVETVALTGSILGIQITP